MPTNAGIPLQRLVTLTQPLVNFNQSAQSADAESRESP